MEKQKLKDTPMIKTLVFALALSIPSAALAAGSDDNNDSPPAKTKTSTQCKDGKIWDEKTEKCLDAKSDLLTDDVRYGAVRELAYAGRYAQAQTVLASMSDQTDARVLTYYGFTHRKSGNIELGMKYYKQALASDPNNLLARSYMGQGFVESGDKAAAMVQLSEIRNRGGQGRWPEMALARAIKTGDGYSY